MFNIGMKTLEFEIRHFLLTDIFWHSQLIYTSTF